MGIGRYELSDAQWTRIEELLPGRADTVGRTRRTIACSSTGCCGCCVPVRTGTIFPSATASTRACISGSAAGRPAGCRTGLRRPRGRSQEPLSDDRFDHRARPPASGHGPQKRGADKALGRSRGGLTTKVHLLANELGLPVDFVVTGGQVNDCTQAIGLLGDRKAAWVLADKGYDSQTILDHIEPCERSPSCPRKPTANSREPTIRNSIGSAIASNAASPGSSTSAASPLATKNSNKTSRLSSASPVLGFTCSYISIQPSESSEW